MPGLSSEVDRGTAREETSGGTPSLALRQSSSPVFRILTIVIVRRFTRMTLQFQQIIRNQEHEIIFFLIL